MTTVPVPKRIDLQARDPVRRHGGVQHLLLEPARSALVDVDDQVAGDRDR